MSSNIKCIQVNSTGVYIIFVQVVSSPCGSSGVSSKTNSSDMEFLKEVSYRSTSVTDLPSAADLVLNISRKSES
jgi:hypothetical protein